MKVNKYIYLWVLQGDYGYGQGFEDLTASENFHDVRNDRKAYRLNDDQVRRLRIVQRREPNPALEVA